MTDKQKSLLAWFAAYPGSRLCVYTDGQGISRQNTMRRVNGLLRQGMIERVGLGKYKITKAGRGALRS